MTNREIIVIVNNKPGVLNRIAGLFLKRGINIDGVSIGSSYPNNLARITLTGILDDYTTHQLIVQVNKLYDVISVKELKKGVSIIKELAFIKLKFSNDDSSKLMKQITKLEAKILDISSSSMVVEVVGEPDYITECIESLETFGILEVSRTGAMGMSTGYNI